MARNEGDAIGRELRQQAVASLLAARPRITQREICSFLAGEHTNPRTGKPYALSTINADVQQLRQEYRDKRDESRDEWIGKLLLLYDELLCKAMKANDLSEVRHVAKSIREMLGLDAPVKSDLTSGGKTINFTWDGEGGD